VCERESVCVRVCVCVRERECVCERESERERVVYKLWGKGREFMLLLVCVC
jgi:hypothetical protein